MRAHAADSHDYRYADSVWIYTVATVGQALAMFFGGHPYHAPNCSHHDYAQCI